MLQFNIDEIEKRTLSGLKDFQRSDCGESGLSVPA